MIIKFKSIRIKSFMSIDECGINLLDRGLVVVEGCNNYEPLLDSNGSGKSAIFEAIVWNLTGVTTRGLKSVTNKYTDSGAEVKLDLVIDGIDYTVTRGESPAKWLKISKDGQDISNSTYTKTSKQLSEILSDLSYDKLISIILLSQGLPGKFTSLSPSSRKARLESISGLDIVIQELIDKVEQAHQNLTQELNNITNQIAKLDGSMSSLELGNQKALDKIQELTYTRTQAVSELVYKSASDRLVDSKLERSRLTKELNELVDRKSKLYIEKSRYTSNLESNEKVIIELKSKLSSFLSNRCPTCGAVRNFNIEINQCSTELEKAIQYSGELQVELDEMSGILEELVTTISEFGFKLDNIESIIDEDTELVNTYNRSKGSIDSYQSIINDNTKELEKLSIRKKELLVQKQVITDQLTIANYYKVQLSRNFRTYAIQSVVSFMNEKLSEISKYLYELQGVVSMKCNGNNIDIYLGDREVNSLSGGELRRVDLIIQLAQRELSEHYSGFFCNLLVLDEVLDYLDASGVSNVLSMVESKSLDVSTLMVVTHRSDITVSYNSKIIVTKNKSQLSTIQEVN